jgi:hypothetical protein
MNADDEDEERVAWCISGNNDWKKKPKVLREIPAPLPLCPL